MSTIFSSAPDQAGSARLYRAIWRWHFYAGLVVVPFLFILALTGMVMVYGNSVETFLGTKHYVTPGGNRVSLVKQAEAAVAHVTGGVLRLVVSPASTDRATVFIVDSQERNIVVSVDPNDARVMDSIVKDDTWFYWANRIHGTLMIGTTGDRVVETVAGLGIILLLTGLYMWWPRNGRSLAKALLPNLNTRGRAFWKEVHVSLGFYLSVVLLFFLVSGLAWAGIWGERIVQPWSTFPAEKWDNVPLSDKSHAAMNHGALKEVPWALEQTPMPASDIPQNHGAHGSHGGQAVLTRAEIDLDSIAALARKIGFTGQFRINVPQGDDGVYTVSADSMDGDTTDATGDRTVHIDQYSGNVLADVRYSDYSLPGKAMAVGIALHQGNLGIVNSILNLAFCMSVIMICISGVAMWWKRRPENRLGAPLYAPSFRPSLGVLAIALSICLLFPLTGIAVLLFALVDIVLPKRFKEVASRTV